MKSPWSPAQIKKLDALLFAGKNRNEISESLHIPMLAVVGKVYRDGRSFSSRHKLPRDVARKIKTDPMCWRCFVWRNWVKPNIHRDDTGCWIWTGAKMLSGYGRVHVGAAHNQITVRLNRLSLEVKIGRLLRAGEWALHKCDRPSCVKPGHLYVGDAKTNARDRKERKRGAVGERSPFAKLTDSQVVAIRRLKPFLLLPSHSVGFLAEALGITSSYAWALIGRPAWRQRKDAA